MSTTETERCGYVARRTDGAFLGQTETLLFRLFSSDELRLAQNLLVDAGGGVVHEATHEVLGGAEGEPTTYSAPHVGRPLCVVQGRGQAGTGPTVREVTEADLLQVRQIEHAIAAEQETILAAQRRIDRLRKERAQAMWWAPPQ